MKNNYSWYNPDSDIIPSENYTPNKDFGHNLADRILFDSQLNRNSIKKEIFTKKIIREDIFSNNVSVGDYYLEKMKRYSQQKINEDLSKFS